MIYANDIDGNRVKASKKLKATCPYCKGVMTPKCGVKMIHHWAHKVNTEDCIYKGETEWHRLWKSKFPESCCEITIEKNGVKHIADVLYEGVVYEFQHSPIDEYTISKRENFYENMIWIFDCNKQFENKQIELWLDELTWKHCKLFVYQCSKEVLLNFNNKLYKIEKFLDVELYTYTTPYGREIEQTKPPKFIVSEVFLEGVKEDEIFWIFKEEDGCDFEDLFQ